MKLNSAKNCKKQTKMINLFRRNVYTKHFFKNVWETFMTSIFVNRSFLFKFVNLIVVSPTFMQKNKIQIFNIINDQWNAFFSRIHINYLRENLIVLKNVLLSFRVIRHIVRFEICYYYQCFIKSNMWLSRRISLSAWDNV